MRTFFIFQALFDLLRIPKTKHDYFSWKTNNKRKILSMYFWLAWDIPVKWVNHIAHISVHCYNCRICFPLLILYSTFLTDRFCTNSTKMSEIRPYFLSSLPPLIMYHSNNFTYFLHFFWQNIFCHKVWDRDAKMVLFTQHRAPNGKTNVAMYPVMSPPGLMVCCLDAVWVQKGKNWYIDSKLKFEKYSHIDSKVFYSLKVVL